MSDEHLTGPGSEHHSVARRSVVAAAWAAPVVAVAVAAPAAAASTPGSTPIISVTVGMAGSNVRFSITRVSGSVPGLTSVTILLYNQAGTTPTLTQSGPPVGFLTPNFSTTGGSATIVLSLTSTLDSTSPLQTWYVDASLVTSNPQMRWGVQTITSTETVGILPPDSGVFTVTV